MVSDVMAAAKLLYNRNLVNAYEGNVSVRDGSNIYITPSAVCKGFLTEEDIIVTDLDGNIVCGNKAGRKPSSEIKLHLCVYRERPDISAVAHAHPPYATAFALRNEPIRTSGYPEMIVLFGDVPLAQYGRPGTDSIWRDVPRIIKERDHFLLANHGLVACSGTTALEAALKLESIECIAKTLYLARAMGGELTLDNAELSALNAMKMRWRGGDLEEEAHGGHCPP